MKHNIKIGTYPGLKTKQFSTLHIEIFEQILISDKTNLELNEQFGYTKRSHCIVDHSRKVMYKLLVLEKLTREGNMEKVIYPRMYKFWWKCILDKHRQALLKKAIVPVYYETINVPKKVDEFTVARLSVINVNP